MFSERDIKRFWSHVKIGNPDECWPWQAYLNKKGYGQLILRINGKNITFVSSRLSWMIHNNKNIPKDILCCHSCDNPCCVNPAHLWLGTYKDNMQDCTKKGRASKHMLGRKLSNETKIKIGLANGGSKLEFTPKKFSEETLNKMSIAHKRLANTRKGKERRRDKFGHFIKT